MVYDASHSATYPGGKFRIMMKYGDPSSIANNPESVTKEPDHSKGKVTMSVVLGMESVVVFWWVFPGKQDVHATKYGLFH